MHLNIEVRKLTLPVLTAAAKNAVWDVKANGATGAVQVTDTGKVSIEAK